MKKRLLALSLALTALLSGCSGGDRPGEGEVALYWPAGQNGADGAALDREYRTLTPEPAEGTDEAIPLLLAALESGPQSPDWISPLPTGTRFRSWSLDGEGVLHLDLSEHYGGLSGMELSLADACIVLTCCQLPQVEAVALAVEGRPRPFREPVLSPEDLLLTNGEQPLGRVEAVLWFPGGEGLVPEERDLQLSIGDDLATAVLQALLAGPEGVDLQRVAPEGTRLLALERTGEGWQVDLSAPFGELTGRGRTDGEQAIARTLWELESDLPVTILVEGEVLSRQSVPEE